MTGREAITWSDKPALKWLEALPVGKGRLGAIVCGRATREQIQLNEDNLWSGRGCRHNPEALRSLSRVRNMMAGEVVGAQFESAMTMVGTPSNQTSYQTLTNLVIKAPDHNDRHLGAYRRHLEPGRRRRHDQFHQRRTHLHP